MEESRASKERSGRRKRSRSFALVLAGVCLLAACATIYRYGLHPARNAAATPAVTSPTPTPVPPKERIAEFHMADPDRGWIRYSDKVVTTVDAGLHWQEASGESAVEAMAKTEWNGWLSDENKSAPAAITLEGREYAVRQSQFLTDRIGWALLSGGADADDRVAVSVDGGATWNEQVTADVKNTIEAEKQRIRSIEAEASLYASPEQAKAAIQSDWMLFPNAASPGDVVLVRHNQAGDVQWQGKTYSLKPFGGGYFAYLPIAMGTKPGEYPIGGLKLMIKSKKFETQYLKVTEQLESMKQDTNRIQADQKRIDKARSVSQPEFLFTSSFIQPIEGILTTPFGYTRYVNGKYDSSHMALDLAAKEGTPIKATNDGVVALADTLYLTGNSIYLDHGMGLFSQYAHLSELRVKTGDRVKKGDIIGLVGTTGFSTGPHLHFTFWANNVPVNPNLFFNTTPFQWKADGKEVAQ